MKVETDVSIHNEEDVIGVETDAVCVPREREPEVSHILRWFLWWLYIFVCGLWFCTHETAEIGWFAVLFVWSIASVTMLTADTLSYCHSICRHITVKNHSRAQCCLWILWFARWNWNISHECYCQMSWEDNYCSCHWQPKQRTIMAVLQTCSCSCSADWIWYSF